MYNPQLYRAFFEQYMQVKFDPDLYSESIMDKVETLISFTLGADTDTSF